jgi:carbonic anhydrase
MILPALPPYDPQLSPKERLTRAVESNVRWTVDRILEASESGEGDKQLADGRMKVAGAVYEIETGRVRFLT